MAEDVVYKELVRKTKGYSGADISNVCRDAAMMPMRKKLLEGKLSVVELAALKKEELDVPVTMKDFLDALKNIQKSVSNDNLNDYKKWMDEFGCT